MDKGGDGGKGGWGWRGVCMSLGEGRVYVWVKKKKIFSFHIYVEKDKASLLRILTPYTLHLLFTLQSTENF